MSDPIPSIRPPTPRRPRWPHTRWITRLYWAGGGVVVILALVLGLHLADEAKFKRELAHAEAVLLGEEPGDATEAAWKMHDLVSYELVRWGGGRHPGRAERLRATAIPALRAGLRSPMVGARRSCAEDLRWLGNGALAALPELEALLLDDDEQTVETVTEVLGGLGPPAEAALVRGIKAARPHTRSSCMYGLSRLGPETIVTHLALLVALLRDDDPRVRDASVSVLGYAKERTRSALPAMTPLLSDADQGVRLHTVESIGEIGASRELVPHLARAATTDKARDVRAGAASALGSLRPEDASEAIPALVALLADPAATVRAHAAGALGRLGPAAAAAIPELQRVLRDRDAWVRKEATAALGRIAR